MCAIPSIKWCKAKQHGESPRCGKFFEWALALCSILFQNSRHSNDACGCSKETGCQLLYRFREFQVAIWICHILFHLPVFLLIRLQVPNFADCTKSWLPSTASWDLRKLPRRSPFRLRTLQTETFRHCLAMFCKNGHSWLPLRPPARHDEFRSSFEVKNSGWPPICRWFSRFSWVNTFSSVWEGLICLWNARRQSSIRFRLGGAGQPISVWPRSRRRALYLSRSWKSWKWPHVLGLLFQAKRCLNSLRSAINLWHVAHGLRWRLCFLSLTEYFHIAIYLTCFLVSRWKILFSPFAKILANFDFWKAKISGSYFL